MFLNVMRLQCITITVEWFLSFKSKSNDMALKVNETVYASNLSIISKWNDIKVILIFFFDFRDSWRVNVLTVLYCVVLITPNILSTVDDGVPWTKGAE